MLTSILLPLALLAAEPVAQSAEKPTAKRFIVLSEFQVWADPSGPEVYRELNKLYLAKGRCHVFNLYPRYD